MPNSAGSSSSLRIAATASGCISARAVLNFAHGRGYDYVFLLTEDFRVPAIKTYLRLGFEPEMIDASHAQRWARLRETVGDRPER